MTARALTLALFASLGFAQDQVPATAPESPLVRGFHDPPPETRPWTYWYWVSDNVSREGITRDLEAMARVGIGEALIGNVSLDYVKRGSVKTLSSEWWELIEHAIREGGRLGVDIGIFNCPGWSQSGGPWVKPEQAMRYLVTAEQRVTGPTRFHGKLPAFEEPVQDVALLAFPAPRGDGDSASAHAPKITVTPEVADVSRLFDGDLQTACALPTAQRITIDIEFAEPFTARSLSLHPTSVPTTARGSLDVPDSADEFRTVRSFHCDRSMMVPNVGPMLLGPVTVAFAAETSRRFRIVLKDVVGPAALAEIRLSESARLEQFVEKQLGKMHQASDPGWDAYLWPPQAESEAAVGVSRGGIVDLRDRVGTDGDLSWEVPEGKWVILRVAMVPTGSRNAPVFPEAQGLEVDKMNRDAVNAHFDAYVGKLLARMPAAERRALKHVVADSWEMGSQNWTDGFGESFRTRYGYDPLPWLPVLTGRIVGSADESDRFLWDLRRLVADRIADDYVGTLRDACHRHGLKLWAQNYGHWGFPAEYLQYGGRADQISGEFWADGGRGFMIELRAAASASHIHGMPVTWAEAFTGGPFFVSTPSSLQPLADWAFTEGINHFALHLYVHQPNEARPGVNLLVGTEFNRHNTWFDSSRSWIDHLRRSQFLLQQGRFVADVAYFIGEDAPKMTSPSQPELPDGYDFDDVNGEAIFRMTVVDGRFTLPGGASYAILVLPALDTMRPELLQKIRDLVAAGGAILGAPPKRSPSLEDHPACDLRVKELAADVWRGCDGVTVRHVRFGQGHVFRGLGTREALAELGVPPDVGGLESAGVLWTHRAATDADIYFLSNQTEHRVSVAPLLRVTGRRPEIWRADAGTVSRTAVYRVLDGGVRIPVELEPRGAAFVVFQADTAPSPAVTSIVRDERIVSGTTAGAEGPEPVRGSFIDTANTFAFAAWVRPDGEIGLPKEADAGVFSDVPRNDVVFPLHGPSFFPGDRHACAGLSVGRNGVAVYEHSTGYFAPVLVHAAAIEAWTHVAVSYEDGSPTLYLNGKSARRGLRSRHVVHLTPSIAPPSFDGEMTAIRRFARKLTEDDIAALALAAPPSEVVVTRDAAGRLEADATAAGSYRLQLADGTARSFEVKPLPATMEVPGPWAVAFPAGMDVPEEVELERLISWPDHPNPAIQCFSGTATYRRSFALSDDWRGEGRRVILDLGRVESMAEVIVNGRNLGVLWKPPFLIDVTTVVKVGTNVLQVRVTNAWQNRLIGDLKYPDGFPGAGRLQFKPFTATDIQGRLAKELAPAGLLGPVRIRAAQRLSVP